MGRAVGTHSAFTPLGGVPLPSRTAWVTESIRRGILAGEFTTGQPLVEAELATIFGVSKTPVRESLKTLAGLGLVDVGEFKGATVAVVDRAMANDVFGVRLLLEPAAVAESVRSGADLSGAKELLDRALRSKDHAERSDLNREFHRVMYSAGSNALLIEMLDGLRERTALITVTLWQSEASWDSEADEHVALWQAASEGNAEEAERITRTHIEQFAERCRARLG